MRRCLALALGDDPMFDADLLTGKPVRPARDVAGSEDALDAVLEVLIDDSAAIDLRVPPVPIRRTATLLGMALKIGQLIVEFDLHPHRSKRLDEVRHARQHEAGTAKFNDHLRSGIEHPIAQSALKHTDDAPYYGFGTVFPAQPDRQSVLVEHWGALIGHLRRGSSWRAHEDVTLR